MPYPDWLSDPRQYTETAVNNPLLLLTGQLIDAFSEHKEACQRQLEKTLLNYLQTHNSLPISVALSMVPEQAHYMVLWQALNTLLWRQQTVFVVLPVVLVMGSEKTQTISQCLPVTLIDNCLAHHGIKNIIWATHWVSNQQLAGKTLDDWFIGGQSEDSAQQFLETLQQPEWVIKSDQQIVSVFAVGRMKQEDIACLQQPKADFSMALMSDLHAYFSEIKGLTVFANPLALQAPLSALANADSVNSMMALEVFSSNAIRSIRLQNLTAGAVCVAQAPNILQFSFSCVEQNNPLEPLGFSFPLSSMDHLPTILNYFINLAQECQINDLLVCSDVILPEQTGFLSYNQAKQHNMGKNPFPL